MEKTSSQDEHNHSQIQEVNPNNREPWNSFFINHRNPLILLEHENFHMMKTISINNEFHNKFVSDKKKETPFSFSSFKSNFSFQSEPVNILALKEKITAFYKKTGEIFQFIFHHIDNKHVIIELSILERERMIDETEFYNLVNQLPEIIFELNNDYTFRFLNQAALKALGIEYNESNKGIHIKEIIPHQDFPVLEKHLHSIFSGKAVRGKTIKIIMKNKKLALLDVYFSLIRHGVKITGIRGIAIDITHRKRIEEKLLDAKLKLDEADKMKTSFLMNMSHEIRTPLNSVLGYTQLLERKVEDPELLLYLKSIKSSGKTLLQLFNDLLDLSKIYAGTLDIYETDINLNKVLDKLARDFNIEIELRKKNIKLKVIKSLPDKSANIIMDDDRLRQVFKGLFNNSLKFTKEGMVDFGYYINKDNIHFFVKDTGMGMDKKIQNEIFEYFHKPLSRKTKVNAGTGIGLTIAKGILEKMNGRIWLESEPGKGTLFNFLLPYKPVIISKNSSSGNRKISSSVLRDKKILIVEDDHMNFEILVNMLIEMKAVIFHARDGEMALQLYKMHAPELILMDINIPKIDGCEVTRKIRAKDNKTIIIAQSAYVTRMDKEHCYNAGCDAFIEKPINEDVLSSTIKAFLTVQ